MTFCLEEYSNNWGGGSTPEEASATEEPNEPKTIGGLDPDYIAAWEDALPPTPPNLTGRNPGTLSKPPKKSKVLFSPQQKLLLLDTWNRSGLPARDFGALVNVSRHTLYAWKRRFEQQGPAGLDGQAGWREEGPACLATLTRGRAALPRGESRALAPSWTTGSACHPARCRRTRRPCRHGSRSAGDASRACCGRC